MSIFKINKINDIIKGLSYRVRKNKFESTEIPKFVFVCGEQIVDDNGKVINGKELIKKKNKRYHIINKLSCDNLICVISEKIYESYNNLDTLTFEELLAELSQDIIIIVESPGTICELGAFTVNERFFKKLLVINDRAYKDEKSFINEGPVKKLQEHNDERYILVDNNYDLFKDNIELLHTMQSIQRRKLLIEPNKNEKKLELRNFIYELLNIIELFEPLTKHELKQIYLSVKGFNAYNIENEKIHKIKTLQMLLKLMESMELIEFNGDYIKKKGNYKYYNSLFNIKLKEFSDIRADICYEIYGNYPERFGEEDDVITINE